MTIDYDAHFEKEFAGISLAEAYHSADSIVEHPEMGNGRQNAKAYALLRRVAQIKSKTTDHHGGALTPKQWTLPAFVRKIAGMDFEKSPDVLAILDNPIQSLMAQTSKAVNGAPEVPGWECGDNFFTMEQAQAMFPNVALSLVN